MPVTRFVAPGPDVPRHTPTLPRRAGVAVGRMGAALLVADEHVAELGVVAEDVVERQDDAARIAEEDVDALAEERLAARRRRRSRTGPRGRASESIALRARSISAAAAVPALGTWRPGAGRAVPVAAASAGPAPSAVPVAAPSVIRSVVMTYALPCARWSVLRSVACPAQRKTLAAPGEGPGWFDVRCASLALPPPVPRLPPGAGDKGEKPEQQKLELADDGYLYVR